MLAIAAISLEIHILDFPPSIAECALALSMRDIIDYSCAALRPHQNHARIP